MLSDDFKTITISTSDEMDEMTKNLSKELTPEQSIEIMNLINSFYFDYEAEGPLKVEKPLGDLYI